jgi:hypothetical protein
MQRNHCVGSDMDVNATFTCTKLAKARLPDQHAPRLVGELASGSKTLASADFWHWLPLVDIRRQADFWEMNYTS